MKYIFIILFLVTIVNAVPYENSIIAWWEFDETGNDLTSNQYDFNITGGKFVTGIENAGYNTNGDGFVKVSGIENEFGSYFNVTYSFWINPGSLNEDKPILYANLTSTSGEPGKFGLWYDDSSSYVTVYNGVSSTNSFDGSNLIANEFNHIVLTSFYDSSPTGRLKVYVNGETKLNLITITNPNFTSPIYINNMEGSQGNFTIDEFMIYTEYFNLTDAQQLYNGSERFTESTSTIPTDNVIYSDKIKTNVCPLHSTAMSILTMGLMVVGLLIILFGFMSNNIFFIVPGSMLIMFISFSLYGCNVAIGGIFTAISLISLIMAMRVEM